MNQMVFFAACRAADLSRQLLDILQFVAADGRGIGYGGGNGLDRTRGRTREMARASERLVEVAEHFVHASAHQPGKEDLWLGLVWSEKKKNRDVSTSGRKISYPLDKGGGLGLQRNSP
jgi:hypothetical protein